MSRKKPLGSQFEYGMTLHLAIFLPNMKTKGPTLSTGKMVIFSSKMSHLEFSIFTKFLPRYPLTYTNYAKFQKNPSTFVTCRARTIKVYGRGTTTKP
jgi:hypothetical protein